MAHNETIASISQNHLDEIYRLTHSVDRAITSDGRYRVEGSRIVGEGRHSYRIQYRVVDTVSGEHFSIDCSRSQDSYRYRSQAPSPANVRLIAQGADW